MEEMDVIDLREVFRIIKKRKWIIVLIPLVAILISAAISFYALTPIYQSSTTMMVGKTYSGENAAAVQYNDLLTANQLVKTYSEIAKSRAVTEQVIDKSKLNITPEAFAGKITVSPLKDTQLIEITVQDKDPVTAAILANRLANVFMIKVVEIMKVDNVQVVDHAVPTVDPVKPNKLLNIAIAGVLGFMIAIGLVFLMEFLNNTIKSTEDINRHLELPVLGSIPKMK